MACNIIYTLDPENFISEMPAVIEKVFDFFYMEADFPLKTFEKSLMRVWVHYEAKGAASWKCEAFNRRGTPLATQTLAIPATSDDSVQIACFDLAITDEVIKVRITTLCGPMSIIYVTADFEPKGQTRKAV